MSAVSPVPESGHIDSLIPELVKYSFPLSRLKVSNTVPKWFIFSISVPPKEILQFPQRWLNHEFAKVMFDGSLSIQGSPAAWAPAGLCCVLNLILTMNPDWFEAKFKNFVVSAKWNYMSVFWFKFIAVLPTAGLIIIRFSFIVESSTDNPFHNL